MALDELFEDAKRRVQVAPCDVKSRSSLWQIFAARGEFDREACLGFGQKTLVTDAGEFGLLELRKLCFE